jgi:hypothetical protein
VHVVFSMAFALLRASGQCNYYRYAVLVALLVPRRGVSEVSLPLPSGLLRRLGAQLYSLTDRLWCKTLSHCDLRTVALVQGVASTTPGCWCVTRCC